MKAPADPSVGPVPRGVASLGAGELFQRSSEGVGIVGD